MCERKPSGRVLVDKEIADDYRKGGESRECLEMALLEAIAKHGCSRSAYKKIKVG